jgi:hypothetical protein
LETCFPAVSSGNTKETAFRLTKKGKPGDLFPKETLAKHVSLMLFPWETGLGTSSVY